MLERPDISDQEIAACLQAEFAINTAQIDFLPLGADRNTAVFRAVSDTSYFVKLRSGDFNEMTVIIPALLHQQQIDSVIAPLSTISGKLWAALGAFRLMVFPFVEGRDGYQMRLQDQHWIDFGRALKALHTAAIPSEVLARIQRETYSDDWRNRVRAFQAMVEEWQFIEPVAAKLAAFLKAKKAEVSQLVRRAEDFAAVLRTQSEPFVLCHADIHAGNILIDPNGHLYIVDWDTLILAPKERDLMYVGGGQFLDHRSPEEEERLFYQGYGQTDANPAALAYYRFERIVQDIAAYCEQLLLTDEGGADRENSLSQLTGQFRPNNVIDMAYRTEKH
jgi:spectinomycin phosphotransferase